MLLQKEVIEILRCIKKDCFLILDVLGSATEEGEILSQVFNSNKVVEKYPFNMSFDEELSNWIDYIDGLFERNEIKHIPSDFSKEKTFNSLKTFVFSINEMIIELKKLKKYTNKNKELEYLVTHSIQVSVSESYNSFIPESITPLINQLKELENIFTKELRIYLGYYYLDKLTK